MKIKIFVNEDPAELEEAVNEFIEANDIATIDIHYIQWRDGVGSVLMEYVLTEDYHE